MVYALYAFCGTIVGDMLNAFAVIPFWDSIMHAFSGVVLCYVGYLLADIFNQKQIQKGGQLNAFFLALFAVCFAVALGAVWELFEYAERRLARHQFAAIHGDDDGNVRHRYGYSFGGGISRSAIR